MPVGFFGAGTVPAGSGDFLKSRFALYFSSAIESEFRRIQFQLAPSHQTLEPGGEREHDDAGDDRQDADDVEEPASGISS